MKYIDLIAYPIMLGAVYVLLPERIARLKPAG